MGKLSKRQSSDISKYEPEKGLKTIAVAEIAEKYFKRAKDADQLFEAISMKLTEQRKYVLWLDTQEKSKGGRGKTRLRSETGLPDRRETHRWRKKLSDPASFEDALNAAKQRCVEICEMAKSAHVTSATGYYEWYTPIEIIEAARATMGGIDVDPATHLDAQKKIKASVCYTVENDGLKQEWPGRVWMNPPYSQPLIEEFCVKLIKEIGEARAIEAITLTNTLLKQSGDRCY